MLKTVCSASASILYAANLQCAKNAAEKKKWFCAVHAAAPCTTRNRAWLARAMLWLLARLQTSGLALFLPQEAPRTPPKAAGA